MFLQLIDAAATRLQTTSDAILAMLVTAWVEKVRMTWQTAHPYDSRHMS